LYNLIRHPSKPRMFGGNIGIWRKDFERVNGFDERFRAWGGEDDDLRLRLRRAGIRIRSILRWTRTYHLWHPRHKTAPHKISNGPNVEYLGRAIRLTRCVDGLCKRCSEDLTVRFVGSPSQAEAAIEQMPPVLRTAWTRGADGKSDVEVEVLLLPGTGRFTGRAECNLLIVTEEAAVAGLAARRAHLVVSDRTFPGLERCRHFGFDQWDQVIAAILRSDHPEDGEEGGLEKAA